MDVKITDYMTVKETAGVWGVTTRMVIIHIERERVPGAIKIGNMWLIPKDTEKPEDRRINNKRQPKKKDAENKGGKYTR